MNKCKKQLMMKQTNKIAFKQKSKKKKLQI